MTWSYAPTNVTTSGGSTIGVVRPFDSISQVGSYPSSFKRTRMSTADGYTAVGSMTKKRRKKVRFRKSFKQRVLSIPPAKHLVGDSQEVVNANVIYTLGFTQQVVQGDSNSQRDGDAIYLEALKINGHFQASTTSNAFKCRILIGYSGEEFNPQTFLPSLLGTTDVFFPSTYYANGIVNPKAFTVLYDTTLDVNSQVSGVSSLQSFSATIPLKRMHSYQANGSVYGKTRNLYAVCVPFGVGTASGTAVGSIYMNYDMIFKNF